MWIVTNQELIAFSVASQTAKPVFDAILEATGENGKSRGKSFDIGKVNFGRARKLEMRLKTSRPQFHSATHSLLIHQLNAKFENLKGV